ncbi:thioester domain-containing protein, partial [Kibdelosporangium lantanae]
MNRVKTLRRGAALVGVATVALLSSVVPANADAVTGVLQEQDARGGEGVFLQGHKPDEKATHTALLALKTDKGEILKTYCVDFNTHTYKDANYTEVPWASHDAKDSTFTKNATKINWLLQNSYPMVDPDDLEAAVKKAIPDAKFTHTLTDAEAIAATQAAAWYYSDGKVLDKSNPTEHAETKDNVLSVFGYLTSDKINKGAG